MNAAAGWYRQGRSLREMLVITVLVALVAALVMVGSRTSLTSQMSLTAEVDRQEVLSRLDANPEQDISYWLAKQRWLLREDAGQVPRSRQARAEGGC